MSTDNPGLFKNLIANLEDVGVNNENIGFANVTMHSENFICIRENKQSSKSTLKIIDMRNGIEVAEKSMTADSVIMNPSKPHLALRAQNTVQIFNIDSKYKISSLQIGFEVIFWTWIDEKTLLLVSENAVYRWDYEASESIPIKWFEKSATLNDCQIINAEVDKTLGWCFISGISLKNGKIVGTIQLYNEKKKVSQVIEGHAGSFFSLESNTYYETKTYDIFAFAVRAKVTDLKLHLIQINGNDSDPHFTKRIVDLPLLDCSEKDFPIRVIYDSVYCLIFVYTKYGYVYIVEPNSGVCVMSDRYSDSPLYLITSSLNRSNHFVLNRRGDVLNTSIDIEPFFSACIEKGPEFYEAAGVFMRNLPIEEQAVIYRNQFDKMKNVGMYQESLLLIANSDKSFLRTFEYLSSIKDFPNINETSALLEYFALIFEKGKLNEVESLELVQLALSKKKLDIVRKWLLSDQIYCTMQLGKVVLEADPELALQIFEKSNSESMILYCLAVLSRFQEFSSRFGSSECDIDVEGIFSEFLKSNLENIPPFLLIIIENRPYILNAKIIQNILSTDMGKIDAEVDKILATHPKFLSSIKSKEINTQLAIRLAKSTPHLFSEYIMGCGENDVELSRAEILPLLRADKNLRELAFPFESDLEECLKLSERIIGKENILKSTNLSGSDVKTFIFKLIENDPKKYSKLCVKMGEFINENDFEDVKEILNSNIDDGDFCDFLIFWSQKLKSNEILIDDILQLSVKIGDERRLLDICQNIRLNDPKNAFELISAFNYRSEALKILASEYSLHVEIISVFASKNDPEEAVKYLQFVGQDILWSNLQQLLEKGISEDFLRTVLECPTDHNVIITAADELEKVDKLSLISKIVLPESCFPKEPKINLLKLKLLVTSNDDLFLKNMNDPEMESIAVKAIDYCETKNPVLALKYYLLNNITDKVLQLSFKLEDWESLSDFLIHRKDSTSWGLALNYENSSKLFSEVIKKAPNFPDTESASCLIKVLVSKEKYELLLKIMSAWLKENDKLKSNRSLQTLYLINLIKYDPENVEEHALKLDSYNVEEIVHVAISQGQLALCLKILERFEHWNYAFKIALYGLKDVEMAQNFAQKSGHPEAWHALAEYSLISDQSVSAVEFAIKAGNFRRQKELVILLHLEEHYEELLRYLVFLKSTPNYEPIYERETFLCLVKLGKTEELHNFISSATSGFANELGKVLYREGSIELASKCFKQAGNYERASSCYLQLGNIEEAAESAIKTSKYELWLDIVKFALNAGKNELARKFGLKCSQQFDRIEELFAVYENCGAYEKLIEIIEIILESSAPQPQVMSLIGEIYCREFTEKLESFINKYYSAVQATFIQTLAKFRRWKEAFKLLLLRSNLDEALELVIKHPSIEFDHRKLTAVIGKIKNQKVLENLLQYYYECDPRMLLELQEEFIERLDIGALIKFFKDRNILFILDKTMRKYQTQNPGNVIVSTGLNEHLMHINDYYGLIDSIKKCPSIDAGIISEKLKSSDHRHFRVLAAKLMANSGEYVKALSILIEEDALIETLMILSQSNNVQYAEAILSRYARLRNAVMFLAVSYVLYDFIRADIIFEHSHRAEFRDLCLPIFCQIMRHKLK